MRIGILAVAAAAMGSGAAAAQEPAPAAPCELHVWASDQYEVQMSGMLSGFGAIGALLDQAGRGDERLTLADVMREDLGPQAQFEILGRRDLGATLGMPGARVVWHDDVLTVDQRKQVKKVPTRYSDSAASCYAELINGVIFYQRAAMYGSNLFGGFVYRDFRAGGAKPRVTVGTVKNPLEAFPPETAEEREAARAELLDAWSKDFDEWIAKKLKR